MAFPYAENPERDFQRLRNQGQAALPVNPMLRNAQVSRWQGATRESLLSELQQTMRPDASLARASMSSFGSQMRTVNREFLAKMSPDATRRFSEMEMRRTGGTALTGPSSSGSDVTLAMPRMRDPFQYFRENSWWWLNPENWDESLRRLREWSRMLYISHPLVPSMIDIYSRFPLLDIEFEHEDKKLAAWYEDLFMNQLDYEEFLFDLAREHWLVGEGFALGDWHEGIGAWVGEQLIIPDDVTVAHNKMLALYEYHVSVPDYIKTLVERKEPRDEYLVLLRDFPEMVAWARNDTKIPVSNVLMKQLEFSVNPWSERGVPILLRAFNLLMHEMSLNAAQQAVADRLYAPLILVTIGFDDMGDGGGPLLPDPSEVQMVRDDMSILLMSDFRLMAYHHGLKIENVFGRENMPRLDTDFERIDMKLMQVFGIGEELLMGGKSNVPYAAGALNRELLTQMLSTYQKRVRKFIRERMEVVADRQGHYEYDKRGTFRTPVMEQALMRDEQTGEEYTVTRPKLAIPRVNFRSMDMHNEDKYRDFLMMLRQNGVPIADSTFFVNIPIEFDAELEKSGQEKLDKTLAEQEFKQKLFLHIYVSTLTGGPPMPVPAALAQEYVAWVEQMQTISQPMPVDDISTPAMAPNVAPNAADTAMLPAVSQMGGPEEGGGGPSGGQRPPESDDARGRQPQSSQEIPPHISQRIAQLHAEGRRLLEAGRIKLPELQMSNVTEIIEEEHEDRHSRRRRFVSAVKKVLKLDDEKIQKASAVDRLDDDKDYPRREEFTTGSLKIGNSVYGQTRKIQDVDPSYKVQPEDDFEEEKTEPTEAHRRTAKWSADLTPEFLAEREAILNGEPEPDPSTNGHATFYMDEPSDDGDFHIDDGS